MAVAATPSDVSPSLVVSTSIVMLLAGVNFLGAIQDALPLGEYLAQPIREEARRLESRLAGPRLVGPHTVRLRRRRREQG